MVDEGNEPVRVLVVEDDATTRDLLLMVLTDEGYAAVGAADGERALALASEAVPALIVLDVRMPYMDGWAFLRAFRERHPQPVPVVVASALGINAEEAFALGAAALLPKPFELDDLLRVVREHASPNEARSTGRSGHHAARCAPRAGGLRPARVVEKR
jgi:CheY-like chemotaxis protein